MLNNQTKYVPYNHTTALNNGIIALNKMYNHLPQSSPVKQYIHANALFLLKPLEGDSPVLTKDLESSALLDNSNTVKLGLKYSLLYTNDKQLKGSAGVYVFFDQVKGLIVQCGSCIN